MDQRWSFKPEDDRRWKTEPGLIVAVDFDAAGELASLLYECGYYCSVARRSEGMRAVVEAPPRFIVLDHEPSDLEAWSLLAGLAGVTSAPIIVVGDDDLAAPTIEALRLGATAYLRKPVNSRELCLRVAVALRRAAVESRDGPEIGDDFFRIDLVEKRASVLELELPLKPTEFRLLVAFARHREVAMAHDEILEMVWPEGYRERDQVKLNVSYLRRSVAEVAPVDPVVTIPGVGYRYEPRRID